MAKYPTPLKATSVGTERLQLCILNTRSSHLSFCPLTYKAGVDVDSQFVAKLLARTFSLGGGLPTTLPPRCLFCLAVAEFYGDVHACSTFLWSGPKTKNIHCCIYQPFWSLSHQLIWNKSAFWLVDKWEGNLKVPLRFLMASFPL